MVFENKWYDKLFQHLIHFINQDKQQHITSKWMVLESYRFDKIVSSIVTIVSNQFNSWRCFSCFSKKLVLKVKICRKSKLKRSSRPFFRGMTGQDRTNGCETTDFLHQNHETSSSINHNRTLSFFNFIRVLLDDLFFTFSCIIWGNK